MLPGYEIGAPCFQYRPLDSQGHTVIRVISILPLEAGESNSSPIRCYLDHVHICPDMLLATGEAQGNTISRRSAIYFDRYVIHRPEEVYPIEIAHSQTQYEALHGGLDPTATQEEYQAREDARLKNRLGKRFSRLLQRFSSAAKTPEASSLSPQVSRNLYAGAVSNMVAHPEEIGGGFSIHIPEISNSRRNSHHKVKRPKANPRPEVQKKFTWGNYAAMSYSWGPEPPTTKILLRNRYVGCENANIEFALIDVKPNLESALRQFRTMRYFMNQGPIWIDALCINQNVEEEKGGQIQMMPHIYGCAGNILVWLGEGTSDLHEAMDSVQEISRIYRTEWQEAFDDADPV